ncbi:MAG: hypothetical protein R2741_03540 [Methanolobus sp.]
MVRSKGLNDWQKRRTENSLGEPCKRSTQFTFRMDRMVSDIIFDFSVKPRLSSERGNAILVASRNYLRSLQIFLSLFQKTVFKGKCAVVTSTIHWLGILQKRTQEQTPKQTKSSFTTPQ